MYHHVIPCKDQSVNVPIDMNNPEAAAAALELEFPETFSRKAWKVIDYFKGTLFMYLYNGEYVLTDESLYLTVHGDGSHEAPFGGPRWVADDLNAVEQWLEELADLYDAEGNVPGWTEAATEDEADEP